MQGPSNADNQILSSLPYRVDALEREMRTLKEQQQLAVTQRESDLLLRPIREAIERVEKGVLGVQQTISDPENGLQKQIQEQRESQDKLLIRILWSIVGTIGAVIIGVAIYYFTHLP